MVDVRINLEELRVELEAASEVNDFTTFWRELIGGQLRPQIQEVFASNGYGRWPPRKDSLPHPLLRKSLRLYRSLTGTTPDSIVNITAHQLQYGTRVPYAYVHEEGRGRVPQRSFLGALISNPAFIRMLEKNLNDWIQEQIDRR